MPLKLMTQLFVTFYCYFVNEIIAVDLHVRDFAVD